MHSKSGKSLMVTAPQSHWEHYKKVKKATQRMMKAAADHMAKDKSASGDPPAACVL